MLDGRVGLHDHVAPGQFDVLQVWSEAFEVARLHEREESIANGILGWCGHGALFREGESTRISQAPRPENEGDDAA